MKRPDSPFLRLIFTAIAIVLVGALYKLRYTLLTGILPHGWWVIAELLLGLFFALIVYLSAQLLRMTFFVLVSKRSPHPFFSELHTRGVLLTVWNIVRRRSFHGARLFTVFALWGLLIFGIVVLVRETGRLDESEFLFLDQYEPWGTVDSGGVTRIFTLATGDNNPLRYLRDLNTIARALKSSGARLVVAVVPPTFRVREADLAVLDSITALGIVLQYVVWPEWWVPSYPPLSVSSQELQQNFALEVGSWAHGTPYREKLHRWFPFVGYGNSLPCVEVGLVAAGRYRGYSDTLRPSWEPDRVRYGGFSIPVTSDGQAISPSLQRFDRLFLPVSAERYQDHDTLQYCRLLSNGKELHYSEVFPSECIPEVRDKIILIAWGVVTYWSYPEGIAVAHANIIESLLHHQLIRKFERLPLVLAAVVVLFGALISLRVRPSVATTLILACGAILYAASLWLLTSQFVLLNAGYPAMAAILAAVVFPLVRLSHENP